MEGCNIINHVVAANIELPALKKMKGMFIDQAKFNRTKYNRLITESNRKVVMQGVKAT